MAKQIQIIQGDITKQHVDAIVNAANSALSGGGGVDGAIHRAAGPELLKASRKLGPCSAGEARITEGYRLPANYVIHAVGPVWRGGEQGEDALLASCYRASLSFANDYDIQSIAFPAISTGAYGYPLNKATQIAIQTVKEWLETNDLPHVVHFVCFDNKTYRAYQRELEK